jgi:hypothetical protein
MFYYSRDRSGEHPARHLAGYAGILQADAYGGYNKLYEADRQPGPIVEATCWAHPWTAPGAQGKNTAPLADYGRVQPSIRPGVAARWPQALMIFAAPFPITGADFASDAPNGLDGAR